MQQPTARVTEINKTKVCIVSIFRDIDSRYNEPWREKKKVRYIDGSLYRKKWNNESFFSNH